jgi:hypothetical protein
MITLEAKLVAIFVEVLFNHIFAPEAIHTAQWTLHTMLFQMFFFIFMFVRLFAIVVGTSELQLAKLTHHNFV